MSEWEELVGADFAEHGFRRVGAGISRATSVLGFQHPLPASTGGWAAERAPGYFPPGTLCGVCVDLNERRVPQEGNTVLRVRPQLVQ